VAMMRAGRNAPPRRAAPRLRQCERVYLKRM
jgi:hypothetical protein